MLLRDKISEPSFKHVGWDRLVHNKLSKLNQSADGSGPLQSLRFLGLPVGCKCLSQLLGIGSNRLRRGVRMVPDLRFGKSKAGSREKSFAVDAFFATLHHRVAETLPDRPLLKFTTQSFWLVAVAVLSFRRCSRDHFRGSDSRNQFRFIRRGRAAAADDSDFDLDSDVEDTELITWLQKPGQSVALQLIQWEDSKKLTKYLPPGNVMELFSHYAATQKLIGASHCSSIGFATVCLWWVKLYKCHWACKFFPNWKPLALNRSGILRFPASTLRGGRTCWNSGTRIWNLAAASRIQGKSGISQRGGAF